MAGNAAVRLTLGELAQWAGAELHGDPHAVVTRVATLGEAGPGSVSFFANARYRGQLKATRATAVVVAPDAVGDCPVAALVAKNPYLIFARITRRLNPEAVPAPGVAGSAVVHPDAKLGENVSIGECAVIDHGAQLGDRVRIGAGAYIGPGARIGDDSRIGARVVVADGVIIGARAVIHPGAVLGADGFGFANNSGRWEKVPQIGTVRLGDDVDIGANTTIDRGALGDTVIGDGVKIDNLVQVAHNVQIGAHTAIAGCVGISGSSKIGKHCMIGGGVGLAGHLEIADGVTVTGMTLVSRSIREPGSVYSGGMHMAPAPAWRKNAVRFGQLDDMYRRLRELERELAALKGADGKE